MANRYGSNLDRSKWLQYVKDNRDTVSLKDRAAHIGIAKQTLSKWEKDWREQKLLPTHPKFVNWAAHQPWVQQNHAKYTQQEMANILGVQLSYLSKKMKIWGIVSQRTCKDQWYEYIRDNVQRLTAKQMAEHIGIRPNAVVVWKRLWREEGKLDESSYKSVDDYREYILENHEKLTQQRMADAVGVSVRTMVKWVQQVTGKTTKRYVRLSGPKKTRTSTGPYNKEKEQYREYILNNYKRLHEKRNSEAEKIIKINFGYNKKFIYFYSSIKINGADT